VLLPVLEMILQQVEGAAEIEKLGEKESPQGE